MKTDRKKKALTAISSFLLTLSFVLLVIIVSSVNTGYITGKINNNPEAAVYHSKIDIDGNSALDTFITNEGDSTNGLSWSTAHVIDNLEISSSSDGISCIKIKNTDRYLIIEECTLSDTWHYGGGSSQQGIRLTNCSNVKIRSCTFSSVDEGILLTECDNIEITDISNSMCDWYIINIVDSHSCSVNDSTLINSEYRGGLSMDNSTLCTIQGLEITGNGGTAMSIYDSDQNEISGNTITDNDGTGLKVQYSNNNEIVDNIITGNTWYNFYMSYSSGNDVGNNDFTGAGEKNVVIEECGENNIYDNAGYSSAGKIFGEIGMGILLSFVYLFIAAGIPYTLLRFKYSKYNVPSDTWARGTGIVGIIFGIGIAIFSAVVWQSGYWSGIFCAIWSGLILAYKSKKEKGGGSVGSKSTSGSGFKITLKTAMAPTAPQQPQQPKTQDQPYFCGKCGTKLNSTQKFCPECGSPRD
ncbi:MAG: zinc-ribbon domain-containing protein [Candidatus Lokiarchaeota archaeon]|nr:zinc-ribbon domain-containing protein [Candidatus Lokiarchaeota archaeon]